jgi:long-chain fatty acid transport protein
MTHPHRRALALAALCGAPLLAQATNGMQLEGYGPIATGMGGASMALDNGLAAATNNPATLSLAAEGDRLDLAVGLLGPHVSSSAGPMQANSSGTRYVMPAFGYGRRSGTLSYGLALFAQGGMGTDYSSDSFLAMGSGQPVRSELGVGRVIAPLAWQATPDLTLAGSLDYVWASLDMRMAASGAQLGGLVTGADGNLAMALPALGGAPWARIDFSNNSKFSGAASSQGYAAKLGLLYQASPELRLGASYHSKTRLKDMRTTATGAGLSAPGFADSGRITVQDFQMPAELAVGAAWQANPGLLIAADLKHIQWSGVMDSFRLRYDSAGLGGSVSFALPQHWKDQTVLEVGASQRLSAQWTARAGLNLANNPVPDESVNPLFPAIVRNHLTLGAGYQGSVASEINASLVYAPTVSVNSPSGLVVSHRQLNLQAMYSHRF